MTQNPREVETRGQMFLIGAIMLAISFVALTMLLNTAIYTENIASRGENVGGSDVTGFTTELQVHGTDAMTYTNYRMDENGDYGQASTYESLTQDWGLMLMERYGSRGILTNVSVQSTQPGERAAQTEHTNFSDHHNGGTSDNWLVVRDTPHVRNATITVAVDSLNSSANDPFTVTVDSTDIEIYEASTDTVGVRVDGNSCTVEEERDGQEDGEITIDISDGTIGGADCLPLQSVFPASSNYEIKYSSVDAAEGTWDIIIPDEGDFGTASDDLSTADEFIVVDAVYSAHLRSTYADAENTYSNTIRIAPGEHER